MKPFATPSANASRQAFTLVELLVVIAIIGILVALLLPAVQSAREAARRMQCSNNVKQVALAMHNFHTAQGRLPIGAASRHYGTWVVDLLPYLEQGNMADKYEITTKYQQSPNVEILENRIETLTCPSDQSRSSWTANDIPNYNYAVNLGNTSNFRKDPYNGVDFETGPFHSNDNGGSPADPSTPAYRIDDIRDGTTNTILLMEIRQGQNDNDLRGLTTWGPGAGCTAHNGPNTVVPDYLDGGWCPTSSQSLEEWPCLPATSANPVTCSARSQHPGGVMIAAGDGSVHFISDSINLETWRDLSTIAGKEVVSLP